MEKIVEKYYAVCTHDDSIFQEENSIISAYDFRTAFDKVLTDLKSTAYLEGFIAKDFGRIRWKICHGDDAIFAVSLTARYCGCQTGKNTYRFLVRLFDIKRCKTIPLFSKNYTY